MFSCEKFYEKICIKNYSNGKAIIARASYLDVW